MAHATENTRVSIPIAYIAGTFPARSETFVYREVRALRAAGWPVTTVSLNEPARARGGRVRRPRGGHRLRLRIRRGGDRRGGSSSNRSRTRFASIAHVARGRRRRDQPRRAHGDVAARVKLLGQAFAALGLARRLRKAGVRHVHCHFAHAPATVGMYAARQLGVPFSFTGHANDLFQRRALLAPQARAGGVRGVHQRVAPRAVPRHPPGRGRALPRHPLRRRRRRVGRPRPTRGARSRRTSRCAC